jgi:protein CpxP
MRDSAASIETIAGDRHQKVKTMTAVDDLRSYQTLSQAHADGMKKVVDAFSPLYDGMSDSQKKAADVLFRHHERHRAAAKKA